jgi:hypothetical protein
MGVSGEARGSGAVLNQPNLRHVGISLRKEDIEVNQANPILIKATYVPVR